MPNKSIQMNKLRTIIRLYEERMGVKTISVMSGVSRNTVKKYIYKWRDLQMSYQAFQGHCDAALYELFCASASVVSSDPRREVLIELLPSICKKLGKRGMTIKQQWEQYRVLHPDGYAYTAFRKSVQHYHRISNPSMRIEHKAGDKMFIDYTGDKLWVYPHGEPPHQVEVFVAILGCSLLTYVEAVYSQSKEDFITACENAFYYYGGVPCALVTDNLKAAVTKANRYEPVLNQEFARFCEHYGVTALPTRARKPKDKAVVENAVKLTYKDIFTRIESLRCPDIKSLNAAVRSALEVHNSSFLKGRNYSRRSCFEEIEQEILAPLNPIRYQIKKRSEATVSKDGHIRLNEDKHHYSVPHIYIGKRLKIHYTAHDVEVFDRYNCIATHKRSRIAYRHTTNPEHLAPQHRAVLKQSPAHFLRAAAEIHEDVEYYIGKIIDSKRYADQVNKSCAGILSLVRKVGVQRLAAACRLAASYHRYSFAEVQDILKNKSEHIEMNEQVPDMPEHENIRGKEYYK